MAHLLDLRMVTECRILLVVISNQLINKTPENIKQFGKNKKKFNPKLLSFKKEG